MDQESDNPAEVKGEAGSDCGFWKKKSNGRKRIPFYFIISQLLQTAIILNCSTQWTPIFSNIIDLLQAQGERPDKIRGPSLEEKLI